MSSFKEVVEILRGRGELPPAGAVSVKSLMTRFQPNPLGSMRALLLAMLGIRPTTRWAIVVVTEFGTPRVTSLPLSWFEKLFMDDDGVASYIRQMSGGRQVFTWRVFGPLAMYTPAQKAELIAKGAEAGSAYLRAEAAKRGIPVSDFDRFFWAIDDD
jgi:hypothetical protein